MERDHVAGHHAGVDPLEANQLANEHHTPDGERERQGHLGGDEAIAQAPEPHAHRVVAAGSLQNRLRIRAQRDDGGRDAKRDAGDDAGREKKQQHVPVEADFAPSRQFGAGCQYQRFGAPPRQCDSGEAAGEGEQQTLREELANQAGRSRAERSAHGHLAATERRAHQRQVCDIDARQQQDDPRGAEQHEKGPAN